jgi:hypothetical protein
MQSICARIAEVPSPNGSEKQSSASKNDLVGIENWSEEDLKKKLADQLKKKRCASLDFANFYRIFLLFGTIL